MKHDSSKKIEYTIGFILMAIYIFTSYVAVDITLSSKTNTIFLYLFVAWGALVTLMYGVREKLSTYTIYYAVFMIISLLSMGYSQEFNILSGQFYLMIVNFLLTFLFQVFIRNEKNFVWMCWFYAISSFVLVLMLQFTGNLQGSESERLGQEFMGNSNTFAMMMMIAVLLELWLIIYGSKRWFAKIILIAMVVYNMYALALSAGRKFIIIPFVFLYMLLLFKTNKKGKRNIILYTLIIVLLIFVAYNMIIKIPVLYEAVGIRMEHLIEGQEDESELDGSTKIRDIMRNDAMAQWTESPVWGYGFDSYKYRANEVVKHFYYSHCNYTEMLYNGGIVMLTAYYWIYYKIISEVFKKRNVKQDYRAFAIAVAISFLIFDYGAVTYSAGIIHIMLAMSLKMLNFENTEEKSNEQIQNID